MFVDKQSLIRVNQRQ